DDQDRAIGGKVVSSFEQVDPWLKHRAAAALHLDSVADRPRLNIPLIVGRRVTIHDANGGYVAGDGVAGDRPERLAQELAVHGARRIQHDAEGPSILAVPVR